MTTNISWAASREDMMLLRALKDISPEQGFYIDVGANSPSEGSVTKIFYDLGWKGINIEPSPFWHAQLAAHRPRDINLNVAASDVAGRLTLYDHPEGGLGTVIKDFAARHEADFNFTMKTVEVDTVTLSSLCEDYAAAEIHFLKIDVEGHEEEAIRGMDFARFRPWILCIEATEPRNLDVMTFAAWEPLVTGAGYDFTMFDGVNRWYVAAEHPELLPAFTFPIDDYVPWDVLRHIHILETRLREIDAANANGAAS